MFECSLVGGPAADFSVAFMASRGDHAALSQLGSANITSPPRDNPGWTRIHHFAQSWADTTSSLNHTVEEVWLEFDVCLTTESSGNPPSVFFRLGYQSPQEPALRRGLSREYVRVAKESFAILEGTPMPPATLSTLAECFNLLPAHARILFLGAMISRGPGTVRVVASGLSLDDMVHYLRRLGLDEESLGHLALITNISHRTSHLWLAIDVGETGVNPRIGFDCYYNNPAESAKNRKWKDLLDFFVDNGICTVNKRNALLRATDMSNRKFDELAWPGSLRRISKLLGPAGFNSIGLHIHHVKVIDRPGRPPEAKAYLCGNYQ